MNGFVSEIDWWGKEILFTSILVVKNWGNERLSDLSQVTKESNNVSRNKDQTSLISVQCPSHKNIFLLLSPLITSNSFLPGILAAVCVSVHSLLAFTVIPSNSPSLWCFQKHFIFISDINTNKRSQYSWSSIIAKSVWNRWNK